ncbi:MAG TPA: ATP-binding protein [Gemmatimonadaceae bacterium]
MRDRPVVQRYGLAVLATALVLLAVFAVDQFLHIRITLLLVTAVVISAWWGGRGPGVLASLLCLPAIVILVKHGSPAATDVRGVGQIIFLSTFVLVALVIGAATESLRNERAKAQTRAQQLEQLNAEVEQHMEEVRTLSEHLQESNDSLAIALASAEDLASRAMRLREATAALADARTESEVADVVVGRGVVAAGAARGVLARVDGDCVEILRAWGYPPEIEARLLGPTPNYPPFARAVKSGEPVWARTMEEQLALYGPAYQSYGITPVPHASATIPLVHGQEVVGALGLYFLESSAFNSTTQSFALMLAQAAADALSRARNYDAERAARQRAETTAQARADVLGIVAHDLRNPLNLVSSSAALMLEIEDLPAARRRGMLEITQRAVRQMNRLIGDLLDATRLQAGRLILDLGDVDACALVRDTGGTLRPAANERHVELRTEPPANECLVRGDEGRLLQVLGNLVGNAIKFTPAGGRVVLSAQPHEVEVVFSVVDTGPGIPQEHLDHLFDRFWQARGSDRRGVGLGLAITKGIVEAHGGHLWVESAVGVGSTFAFAIPASASVSSGHGETSGAAAGPAGSTSDQSSAEGPYAPGTGTPSRR